MLKFGNPVVLGSLIDQPEDFKQLLILEWPPTWGYWLLAGVAMVSLAGAQWRVKAPRLLVTLPLAWLLWELVAGSQTIDAGLTHVTLIHFATCAACFYLGLFVLSGARGLGLFWAGLLAGFGLVLLSGFFQHFGGLEATRRYVELYSDPATIPPEFKARLESNRIFSTLVYPNSLAGVLLLLLPVSLGAIASRRAEFTLGARRFLLAVSAAASLACLFWSGSKAGWLLMLFLGMVYVSLLSIPRRVKLMVIGGALALGLTGFFVKYSGYFAKGATSVVARGDYWRAAIRITGENPLFGTGPGTFKESYDAVKPPKAEPTRLTHNDYLEQACDSGVLGCILYMAMVAGTLVWTFQKGGVRNDPLKLAVWLGVLGWALHSLMEFHLYVPALAWPAFAFLGWLVGSAPNHSTGAARPATMHSA